MVGDSLSEYSIESLEFVYDQVIANYYKLGKGAFYIFDIQVKHVEEFDKYMRKARAYSLISVTEVDEGKNLRLVLYTSRTVRQSNKLRSMQAKFQILFYREVTKSVNGLAISTIPPDYLTSLKIAIGDTGKKPKFKFICRINNKIFIEFKNKLKYFDLDSGKARNYWESKQINFFKVIELDNFTVDIFEKYFAKDLLVK